MKVLVDTCAWSLLLRRRNKTALGSREQAIQNSLREAIQDGRVTLVGPIRQEVLSGIKDPAQFEKLRTALSAFPDVTLAVSHYEEAARLFNLCRSRSTECGATDILMCAVASRMGWSILTCDKGLERCIQTLRAEGILIDFL